MMDNELLISLATNLRNARNTFGEASPQYASLKRMIDEYVAGARAHAMQQQAAHSNNEAGAGSESERLSEHVGETLHHAFGDLAIRPKPQ
ncbi:hypothetical protein BDY21DRAFT_369238 [Lineolata rhizophorae]|uniref:Uncharacterized protein n=1 Tax=Lineolata rhizophorae TaxID=578093 RepID=A0A6A6PB72_9PEZI|nr:hypothetical protein BDY21DRAFT_369238 [Lineolata rhizophorae]